MIYAIGIDWEVATLAQREACALAAGSAQATLQAVAACPQVSGCALLATCNRFEFYLDATQGEGLAQALCTAAGITLEEQSSFACEGDEATRRLMEIAAGLRSQILGEDQIITQVRDAQRMARELGTMSPVLETLFRTAVTAGKAVRANVKFFTVPSSCAHKAVEIAAAELGGLEDKRALVIGNGNMGRLMAELLVEQRAQVTITLRTYKHGATTVPFGCTTVPYEHRAGAMEGADLLVSATKSPHCTVTAEMLRALTQRPGVCIDVALPRDIEEGCRDVGGVRLFDMDDLQDGDSARNSPEVLCAHQIIDKHMADFAKWQRSHAGHEHTDQIVAVFAGTSEGRILCERLSAAGVHARAFVATEYGRGCIGELPGIDVRAGRLNADDMAGQLAGCSMVVDATHPYAAVVSENIVQAAKAAKLRYVRLVRPQQQAGEGAVFVDSVQAAAAFLETQEGTVFSTCGSKDVGKLAATPALAERLWVRVLPSVDSIEACLAAGVASSHVVCMQGPFSFDLNLALLRASGASWMVTKDTGKAGGFMDKVAAAEEAGVRVVVIARPVQHEEGLELDAVCKLVTGKEAPQATGSGLEYGKRFPLFTDIEGWPCLVVGAGKVGLRRAGVLRGFGADVRVVAPEVAGELPQGVTLQQRTWRASDLDGCRLVVAATSERNVNAAIAAECRQRGVPVSVADCPEDCSFFFPAVCATENLCAGVVSQGESHKLVVRAARAVRSTLAEVDR